MSTAAGHSGRALVVGAGLAGLTAAWRLQRAGFEVEVFEREAHPGGRVKSIRLAGCTVDTGATVFLPAYAEALALIEEMGLTSELEAPRGAAVIPRDGQMHAIDIGAPWKALFTCVIGWRSKFSLVRLLFFLLAVRSRLNFLSLADARSADSETLHDYCRSRFPAEVYTYLLNPAIKFLYLHNGCSGSVVELLWWIAATSPGTPKSLRRGSSSLTDALASRLKVHTQTEVTQVTRDGEGVALTVKDSAGQSQVHCADVCVVTVPGPISAAICRDGLSEAQRSFLRSTRYDPCIAISLSTRQRPARDALMFMLPDEFDADLATVIFAHHIGASRVPADRGIVNAYFMRDWCERHGHESDEALARLAQERLSNWVPEAQDLHAWHVQRWSQAAAISEVGACERIGAFESEVDQASPIQIIGDFLAQASMNVAVATANRAAQRLISASSQGFFTPNPPSVGIPVTDSIPGQRAGSR
ncbi:MAG: protoporphyrinogen/coproporphyrinogen oxidase [Panacagrimonas sp.]